MGSMYRPPQDKFKKMNVDELLDSLYYDATTGYQGMEKLFHKAKQYNNSITRNMVQSFLDNQPSYQLTKQITITQQSNQMALEIIFKLILCIYLIHQLQEDINIY